jgi:hypothetical protein
VSIVLVELLRQPAVVGRVPSDHIQKAVRVLEHVDKVVLIFWHFARVTTRGRLALRMQAVEEVHVRVGDVEEPLLQELRDGFVYDVGYSRGAQEPGVALTQTDAIVSVTGLMLVA